MFERFTERARQVVVLAQDEQREIKHNYIGTEHILLGLLREEEGLAARTLVSLGVAPDTVRQRVTVMIGAGDEPGGAMMPFTPRSKKVLELALREARSLRHNYIGTEHVLLALARENEGVASRVLDELGADSATIRGRLLAQLSPDGSALDATRDDRPTRLPSRGFALSAATTVALVALVGIAAGVAVGWLIWG